MALWIEITAATVSGGDRRVEAYVALWIEIYCLLTFCIFTPSRLMWPCGLKFTNSMPHSLQVRRGLCGLVD